MVMAVTRSQPTNTVSVREAVGGTRTQASSSRSTCLVVVKVFALGLDGARTTISVRRLFQVVLPPSRSAFAGPKIFLTRSFDLSARIRCASILPCSISRFLRPHCHSPLLVLRPRSHGLHDGLPSKIQLPGNTVRLSNVRPSLAYHLDVLASLHVWDIVVLLLRSELHDVHFFRDPPNSRDWKTCRSGGRKAVGNATLLFSSSSVSCSASRFFTFTSQFWTAVGTSVTCLSWHDDMHHGHHRLRCGRCVARTHSATVRTVIQRAGAKLRVRDSCGCIHQ